MAQNATSKKHTSKSSHKARLDAKTMSEIVREAKSMIFKNSAKYTTATHQAQKAMSPEDKVIIKGATSRINHIHAVKTRVYQPRN